MNDSAPVQVEAAAWPGKAALPPQPSDDTTYVWYVAAALVIELLGGPAIGVLIYLARSGVLPGRLPELVQAHGWLQLQGWAGLFVAGMAQRLVPRLAGRPPVRKPALPLLALLVLGHAGDEEPGPSLELQPAVRLHQLRQAAGQYP